MMLTNVGFLNPILVLLPNREKTDILKVYKPTMRLQFGSEKLHQMNGNSYADGKATGADTIHGYS
jgi:hypothetical protein